MKQLISQKYYVIQPFEPAEEGGFVVTVPKLPGLVTEGDTFEEAVSMVQDAIKGYIEVLQSSNESIPEPDTVSFTAPIDVSSLPITRACMTTIPSFKPKEVIKQTSGDNSHAHERFETQNIKSIFRQANIRIEDIKKNNLYDTKGKQYWLPAGGIYRLAFGRGFGQTKPGHRL